MPKSDTITIETEDLRRIVDAISTIKFYGLVKIIDTGDTYTVRDISDFKITEVGKSITNY